MPASAAVSAAYREAMPDRVLQSRLCDTCGYDISATVDDGFARCPECGQDIPPPGPPVLREARPMVRGCVLAIGLAPSILAFGGIVSVMAMGEAGPIFAVWAATLAPVHMVHRAYERWRNRRGFGERAWTRTFVVAAGHFGVSIIAIVTTMVAASIVLSA